MSLLDVICNNAQQDLDQVPAETLQMSNLKMLYLENNRLITLPEDFFYKLPLLNWLDLRNNQLTTIPASIEYHSFLENILLQNNKISKLPNELGLVPNLKVLQLSGNPIQYPSEEILQNGVDDICTFLKQEYDKDHSVQNTNIYLKDPLAVVCNKISSTSSTSSIPNQNSSSEIEIRRAVRKRFTNKNQPSILTVKSLSKIHQNSTNNPEKINLNYSTNESNLTIELAPSTSSCTTTKTLTSSHKVHKIISERSKLSVQSHFRNKYVHSSKDDGAPLLDDRFEKRAQGQQLKDLWLDKLKDLLRDQEKIIQQERNLNVLNEWRLEKKQEPMRAYDSEKPLEISKPPYDIDPEYSRMPSRSDLSKQLDELVCREKKKHPRNVDVHRLINNLIKQLQEIETSTQVLSRGIQLTPRRKLENTEKEIRMIMDLHKKISTLQSQN